MADRGAAAGSWVRNFRRRPITVDPPRGDWRRKFRTRWVAATRCVRVTTFVEELPGESPG